jgi:tyrosyl-tRNA synthetase
MFTFMSPEEIDRTMGEQAQDPGKRVAQRLLARDVTTRVHGAAATEEAIRTSEALFSGKGASQGMPERKVSRRELGDLWVVELLVASGLASSKADARRGIQGRGFYLNDEPIETTDLRLGEDQLQGPPDNRFVILRKGKKNYVRLVLQP